MTTRRFEVTRVSEPIRNETTTTTTTTHPSEIIPLVHIENEIPLAPSLPSSLSSINRKNNNRLSSRLFNIFLQKKSSDAQRRATITTADTSINKQIKKSSSVDIIHNIESTSIHPISSCQTHFTVPKEIDEHDADLTIQSNNYDTNTSRIPNKFLQELRLKRRELREKSKNISIDQRIAFHRRQNEREILRAQDIFDVHFELNNDNDNINTNLPLLESNFFTEESQEKIRNDIYNELNRQRTKQYHKHHKHLLLGRALLMFMTSILAFMSFTLIYVVSDLYNRANYLDVKLPDNEFIPMIYDKTTNFP